MTEQPDKGAMSYSCVFYAHQFCDGEAATTQPGLRCACPCHYYEDAQRVVLK